MGRDAIIRSEMESIDEETLKWLLEFSTWKRRKTENPSDINIRFLLEYMAKRLYDYYFLHRNYVHLVPMLEAYGDEFGNVEGLSRMIKDLKARLSVE